MNKTKLKSLTNNDEIFEENYADSHKKQSKYLKETNGFNGCQVILNSQVVWLDLIFYAVPEVEPVRHYYNYFYLFY